MSWNELREIFPDLHGWWIYEPDDNTKKIMVVVSQKYEGIPEFYFSQTLGEFLIIEQEISGPIVPY